MLGGLLRRWSLDQVNSPGEGLERELPAPFLLQRRSNECQGLGAHCVVLTHPGTHCIDQGVLGLRSACCCLAQGWDRRKAATPISVLYVGSGDPSSILAV